MQLLNRLNSPTWLPRILLAGLLITLASCGPSPLSTSPSGTFSNVYSVTLSSACIQCHVPGGAATVNNGVKLDFSTQALAYSTLTSGASGIVNGQTSKNICPGVRQVVTGDPTRSYFAAVLFTKYYSSNFAGVSGCTPYSVHLQDQNLSAAEQTSIAAWIQAGALNN